MRILAKLQSLTILKKINVSTVAITGLILVLVVVSLIVLGFLRNSVHTLTDETEVFLNVSSTSKMAEDLLQFMQRSVATKDKESSTEFNVRLEHLTKQMGSLKKLTSDMESSAQVMLAIDALDKSKADMLGVFKNLANGEADMAIMNAAISEELYMEFLTILRKLNQNLGETLPVLLKDVHKATMSPMIILLVVGLCTIAVSILINNFIKASITPLARTLPMLDAMAQGDLTQNLDINTSDEVGRIATGLNSAVSGMRSTIQSIEHSAGSLAKASQDVASVSASIGKNALRTSSQATLALNSNVGIETHIRSVMVAVGQLKTSFVDVESSALNAANTAAIAVNKASETNALVMALDKSGNEITNVTQIITKIAGQTNLLALNAAIEAARAGESGRGFAVVADEVRKLASATSHATSDISTKIQAILNASKGVTAAIVDISTTIQEINNSQSQIALSVVEQTKTTNAIHHSVAEAVELTSGIGRSINEVVEAARNTSVAAESNQEFSDKLAVMAENLQQLITKFKC